MRDYLKSLAEMPRNVLFRNEQGKPLTYNNIQYYFHSRAVETGVIKQITPVCSKCGGKTVRGKRAHSSGLRKIGYQCRECLNVDWACDLDVNLTSSRYGVNHHEIRDLMRSRWRGSGAELVVAEFMMGHDIDPNEYDKMKYTPSYALQEYRKALPWLNILSVDPTKVDRTTIDEELEGHKAELDVLRREVAKMRKRTKLEEEALRLLRGPDILEQLRRLKDNL